MACQHQAIYESRSSFGRTYDFCEKKKISIGFLSQARTAATVAEIRVFESFRSNSETGKECHARIDGRTVNGVDGYH